jgi:hypothetical protein
MTTLFMSYSHADRDFRDQLEKHLSAMKRSGELEIWTDREIKAGDHIDETIATELENADVVILLMSSDFLASNYCYEIEAIRALERHEIGDCKVIPVILRPCDWQKTPFGKLLAAPESGKPVVEWTVRDRAYQDVVEKIRAALPRSQLASGKTVSNPYRSTENSNVGSLLRSGNLRLAKKFSDVEKDDFLHRSFELMHALFKNSLDTLKERNEKIDTRLTGDVHSGFSAKIYRDGQECTACTIKLDTDGLGIAYLSSAAPSFGNSYNEMLSLQADDQEVFFSSIMGQHFHSNVDRLSDIGAANYYWDRFIEPLQ